MVSELKELTSGGDTGLDCDDAEGEGPRRVRENLCKHGGRPGRLSGGSSIFAGLGQGGHPGRRNSKCKGREENRLDTSRQTGACGPRSYPRCGRPGKGSLGACARTPEVPRASWVSLGKVLHCLVSKLFVCKVEIALRSSRGGCWRMKSQQSAGQGLARGDAMSDNSGRLPTRRAARGRCARGDMCLILKAEGER